MADSSLRELYALGLDASTMTKGKNLWGSSSEVAAKLGKPNGDVGYALQLVREYDAAAFERLCKYGSGSKGKPLTKSHMFVLLSIDDRNVRDRLAKQAAEESWPMLRLRSEAKQLKGMSQSDARGGKPSVQNPANAVYKTRQLTQKWLNWAIELQGAPKNESGALGRGIGAVRIKAAQSQMQALRTAIDRLVETTSRTPSPGRRRK